ncbi:ankyrin repeat-containing domain protein [Aspergillus californicus]
MSAHLPLDVLYAIWDEIPSSAIMSAFSQMSHRIYQTFNPKLYRHAVAIDNGASAMIWAALNNREVTMQKLLEQGADPTVNDIDSHAQPDESLERIVRRAMEEARTGCRSEEGASIDIVVGFSQTPLAWAITHGYTKIVKLLIAKDKAQVNARPPIRLGISKLEGSPLAAAARCGYEEIVRLLLNAGAVVALTEFDHASPLHWAVWNNHERMIGLLVDRGADLKATDAHWMTPLHWAARDGHVKALEVLLDRGAKVDGQGKKRTVALAIAAARDNSIARVLLARNANIEARDRSDRTPLHIAAQSGKVNNIRDLLRNGADPTATDKYGYTPVSIAVQSGNAAAVLVLLVLLGGRTPLGLISQSGNLLLSCGIDIPDFLNRTPLFYATIYNQESIVRLLLSRGSTATHVQTHACRSPLSFAKQHKLQSILQLLTDPSKATVDVEGIEVSRQAKRDIRLYMSCDRCSIRISCYDEYSRCTGCGIGGFNICVECIANGMSCDDASHTLETGKSEW